MKDMISLIFSSLLLLSCSDDSSSDLQKTTQTDLTKEITINTASTYQTIESFSASDCWTPNYVGKYWTESEKEAIAKLLFSQEIIDGNPVGIGLSMWRFNLGGGSAEQGNDSDIDDVARRAECFLQQDGSLDWSHQAGQQYFLSKAKELGCSQFVMFSNTPPVYYTYNGKGYSSKGAYSNLKNDCYDDFANYMATVAKHFKEEKGIEFTYISPVNEPQYNWDSPSQEGSGWQNSEVKNIVTELDKALTEKGLSSQILISESGDWEYLYKEKNGAGRSNQIDAFFNPTSVNYVGNLSHISPIICGHSYWTETQWTSSAEVRTLLATAANTKNLKIYQTEWSMMSDTYENYPGHDKASDMDMALVMSHVIHQDLSIAGVSSWSYWTSMDVERWGHKSRFLLIKLVPANGVYGDISESGTHEASKTLWTLGNYSLFIRPGYKRVDLNITNSSNSFFGTAYISPNQDKLVAVYTNLTSKSIGLDLSMQGLGKSISSVKQYTTNLSSNLKEEVVNTTSAYVSPQSVVTVVYELK